MKKFLKLLIASIIVIFFFRTILEYFYQQLDLVSILFGIFSMTVVSIIQEEINSKP